ncbi:MAG: outer membrane protein assembly factor BamE domain-containing protein [Gammaproteobacteria bacterium]
MEVASSMIDRGMHLKTKRKRCNVNRWTLSILAILLLGSGCASIDRNVEKLEPGMSKQQVLSIMGEPADRSFRGTDEAWRYQEVTGFGQCKYTTIWIRQGKLVGVSTRRGGSVFGCGLGSEPVNWQEMPSG